MTGKMNRVRFQEAETLSTVVCEITPRSEMSQEDHYHTWFSSQDYTDFKSYGKLIAKELRRSGRGRLLEGSLQDIHEDNHVGDIDIVQQMLIQWSRQGASCRGLERWIHVAEGKKRKRAQRLSIQVVLEAQELESQISPALRAEKLRAIADHFTTNARTFAYKMGVADATANFLELEQTAKSLYYLKNNSNSPTNAIFSRRPLSRKVINCSPMA